MASEKLLRKLWSQFSKQNPSKSLKIVEKIAADAINENVQPYVYLVKHYCDTDFSSTDSKQAFEQALVNFENPSFEPKIIKTKKELKREKRKRPNIWASDYKEEKHFSAKLVRRLVKAKAKKKPRKPYDYYLGSPDLSEDGIFKKSNSVWVIYNHNGPKK